MADMDEDLDNDDQWLYGDGPEMPDSSQQEANKEDEPIAPPGEESLPAIPPNKEVQDDSEIQDGDNVVQEQARENEPEAEDEAGETLAPPGVDDEDENGEQKQNGDGSDKEDSEEDSDDDINVVIGDIKSNPSYTSLNIKRGGLLTSSVADKSKQAQPQTIGKFTVEEFDQMGMINGINAADYNLDNLEEKPWRKPGADITDYFNYGFNEDTWKAYCERQKRLRCNESGVGLMPLNAIGLPRGPIPILNDNSKYTGNFPGIRKAGPPPGRRMTGPIDVIGGPTQPGGKDAPKENVIQVMTADRREYSRKPPGFPDMSMPPPSSFESFPPPEFGFNPEPDPFYGGYEPTQDLQWGRNPNWAPSEIKSLTPGPLAPAPVPPVNIGPPIVPLVKESTPPLRSRDRDISRSRSEKPRDRDRERSHRRERSRSRSRRHKSRSRSPSHRHRKKKSRRHEDSD